MGLELFPHNEAAYRSAAAMLEETGKAAVIHPTGTGKSFIAFRLCGDHPDKTVCWLSPSEHIFRTQKENLIAAGGEIPGNIRFFTYVRYNYTGIPLEQGSVYKVTFDDVEILAGDTQGVGLRLCNTTTEKDIGNIIFDISYCRAKEGFTWTFRTPETDDELRLLFYAGIYGHTAGNRVVYRNVRLEKWAAA